MDRYLSPVSGSSTTIFFQMCIRDRRNAFITSITSSFIAAIVNVVFGLIVAWTLVKYDFPGKWLLDGLIELPFALPTAVAGITLSKLYSGTVFCGKGLGKL